MIVTNSLTGGGAERSMNLISNELYARGWKISLVPINSSSNDKVIPLCEVFPLNRPWRGGVLDTLKTIRKFNSIVKVWKPDVIVLNCDLPELFGALVRFKGRLVGIEHVNYPWITRPVLGRAIRRALQVRGVIWTAVSPQLNIWPGNEKPRFVLLNSIGESNASNDFLGVHNVSVVLNRLVFVGRLTQQKRPSWALEISSRAQMPIEIIGDGVLRHELQLQSDPSRTTFTGMLNDPWRDRFIGDLIIIPSEYEGDGLVVIEALQQGLPILVSDIPEFRRFGFPERNYCESINVFVSRIEEFREKIEDLIIPSEISDMILRTRSSSNVAESWEKFLHSL
jgi:glycosyltransferase involved in cell wall biosynthesis